MKRLFLFSLASFFIFISSKSLGQNHLSSNQATLLSKVCIHPFSDPVKPDKFMLSIKGRSLINGKGTIRIINFSGKEIFKKTFISEDLLGDLANDLTPHQKIDTIKSRVKHFFDESNFVKPAIDPTEKFDEDQTDIKTWKDIKSDRSAIGFIYSMYYESTFGIAWSKKNHKVVQFFYSD